MRLRGSSGVDKLSYVQKFPIVIAEVDKHAKEIIEKQKHTNEGALEVYSNIYLKLVRLGTRHSLSIVRVSP